MANRRPKNNKARSTSAANAPASAGTSAVAVARKVTAAKSAPTTQRTIRETIESIAVAFVLAFLFRTFEAEAFVIPTGSMAPTLQGRHKDVICPECQFRYRVSASSEVDDEGQPIEGQEVTGGTCPNCRFPLNFEREAELGHKWPTYNGDRILVAKFPYDLAEPDRWDVVVFRYPGNAKMNYIKRLVGRPHETVRIFHGDIYIQSDGDGDGASHTGSGPDAEEFAIAHKPPDKVRAMSQTVYDNDYIVPSMTNAGWPLRWQNWPAGSAAAGAAAANGAAANETVANETAANETAANETAAAGAAVAGAEKGAVADVAGGGWQSPDGGRSYSVKAGQGEAWIRYQHFIPGSGDWFDLTEGHVPGAPHPRLISDFYAYNTNEHHGVPAHASLGQNWVGDLLLEASLTSHSSQGTVLLDLVRAGRHFQCAIDLASGEARLDIDGAPDVHPRATTALRGTGQHRVAFANVDRQLTLWVDGSVVQFDTDTAYVAVGNDIPNRDDLAPAGIGSRDAALEVTHIVLKRDVYYIAARRTCYDQIISDYDSCDFQRLNFFDFFAEPDLWTGDSIFAHRRYESFPLAADQFFVLGDNSPASKDSRLWSSGGPEYYVSRELLIGKALFIYWPHSFHRLPFRIPFTESRIPFPFFPNVKDMGFVR